MTWPAEKELYLSYCKNKKLSWFYSKLKIKDIILNKSELEKLQIAKMFWVFVVGFRNINNKLTGDEWT